MGARKKHLREHVLFSTKFALRASEIASLWNICFANVKYSLTWMWANFISHRTKWDISQCVVAHYFTFGNAEYFTKYNSCNFILRAQEKRPFSNGLFSIQSEGLACNLTWGEHVIAEGVCHHASECILLRIDYIQHFVLIPYRRQAADFIHGFAVILWVAFLYYEHILVQQFCTLTQKSLIIKGFSCF